MPTFQDLLASGARWDIAGDTNRAWQCFHEALDIAENAAQRADAACRLAHVFRRRCDWDAALEHARLSRAAAREGGLIAREAEALNAEATVYQSRGEFAEAARLFREMLLLTEDQRTRALAMLNLGSVTAQQGRLADAERVLDEAHRAFAALHDVRGEAFALNSLGRAFIDQGELDRARDTLQRALDTARASLDVDIVTLVTLNRADLERASGNSARAAELASEALVGFRAEGNRWREIEALRLLGDVASAQGDNDAAERHFRRAFVIAEEVGAAQEIPVLQERLDRVEAGR